MTDLRQFRTLARNWEAFAQADPLFGVLSDPTKFGSKWDVREFFESGDAHVRKLLRILHELGATYAGAACLDFGCGVGRLTKPLSEHFKRAVGVDVSSSMIRNARKYQQPPHHVEFVRNPHPDLRLFPDASFDFVHTCLVLQHIPPEVSVRYIGEFFRIAKPGGLIVFQLPAATISEDELTARHALPDAGYDAQIVVDVLPAHIEAGETATVRVSLTNTSHAPWRHDIPAGRHICIANHWLRGDGSVLVPDDGRAHLPVTLAPGESTSVDLTVHAPQETGVSVLEVDLVQERVCWFAQKGSQTTRVQTRVVPSTRPALPPPPPVAAAKPSLVQRFRRWLHGGTPTFEMHIVPRDIVEGVITTSGGTLLHAIDDNAAGDRWLSYTYVCRKQSAG